MHSPLPATLPSKGMLWSGRVLTTLIALFLLFDGSIKVLKVPAAVEGTVHAGYPQFTIVPIGLTLLICLALYLLPRTSILGAILLTGYLGGATATMVRISNPWFLFPTVFGILVWTALYLRDGALRALLPLRS